MVCIPSKGKLRQQIGILSYKHGVICVVGAGGKTSLIHALAEEFKQDHKGVIITTTTHMIQPITGFVSGFDEKEIGIQLQKHGIITVGIPCENGKIKGLDMSQIRTMSNLCDKLLIEADGAHQKPMKVPAEYEPVLPDFVDLVIGIQGASAIGQPLHKVCHRFEIGADLLHTKTSHIVTLEDLEYLLLSEKGQRKDVNVEYCPVIGQGELLDDPRKVMSCIKVVSRSGQNQKK
ncbi:MAG: selenium cofactor biosynthesis protein YqeC [Lachnospiraceae bacterium]